MKKIKNSITENFYLRKDLYDRYVELKKADKNITMTTLFKKGFNQIIKDTEGLMSDFEKSCTK